MAWIETKYRVVHGKKTREKLYFVYGRVGGVRVCKPAGPVWETAKNIKREMENEHARPGASKEVATSVKAAYDEYEVLIKKSRAKGTWTAYSWGLDKLLDFLTHDRNLKSVGKTDILKFRTRIMQAHSINGMLDILRIARTFFNYCIECGYIQINPASGITKGIKEVDVAVFLEDGQVRHILSCIDNPDIMDIKINHVESKKEFTDIVKTVLLTGMREGDVAAFKASFVRDGKIFIEKGKGQKPRVIPINSKLKPILQTYIGRGTEFIFQGWNERRIKSRWNRLYKRAKKAMKTLPDRIRFHDLRHTFASNYLRGGGTLADLQIILGHSNIKTTVRYAHFQESDLLAKMEKVKSDFLDALPPQFKVL